MPPIAVTAAEDAAVVRKQRRVSDAPERRATAIGPPPLICGGPCLLILTVTQSLCDNYLTSSEALPRLGEKLVPRLYAAIGMDLDSTRVPDALRRSGMQG